MKNLKVEKIELSEDDSFGFVGYSGGTVDLSSYGLDAPVVYDVESMVGEKPPILYDHRYSEPLGHTTELSIDSVVSGKGIFSIDSQRATEVKNSKEKGFPYQLSLGLGVKDATIAYVKEGTVQVNNQEIKAPCYIIRNTVIEEVSVCVRGRDTKTYLLSKEDLMTIKNSETSLPSVIKDVAPPEKQPEKKTVENTVPSDPPAPKEETAPPVTKVENTPSTPPVDNSKLLASLNKVNALMNKHPEYAEFIQNSLENGLEVGFIENQLALLNKGPGLPTPGKKEDNSTAHLLSAAMDFFMGREEKKILATYGETVTNQAGSMNLLSLREVLVNIANSNGGNFQGHSDIDACVRFLHSKTVNNTYSSIDLPNFFMSTAQRMRDDLWEIESPMAMKLLPAVSKKDFRTEKTFRPQGGNVWEKVTDKNKISHFQFSEEMTYETRLETIAQLLVISRQQVINDDLNVIKDLYTMMVEGSVMYPDMQLLKLIFDNASADFRQTGTNYFTGAGATLNRDNLSTIYDKVRQIKVKKQNGSWVNVGTKGWYLVVGPKLFETAWELTNQQVVMPAGGTNLSRTGTKNYWYGRLEPMEWAQIGNSSLYSSAEEDDWMLIPKDPRYAPYSMSFLGSSRKPVIESVSLPMEFLGFGTRGYFDTHVQEREPMTVGICRPSK